jgi:uncharacterized membrane protein
MNPGNDFLIRHSRKYLLVFFAFILTWCYGIVSPVIFQDEITFLAAKPFLNQVYSTACHRVHEKTPIINGESIFVCSRCAGIYLGIVIASLFTLITLPKKSLFNYLLLTSLLIIVDAAFSSLGFYNYSKLIALVTGSLFGSTVFLFVQYELKKSLLMNNHEK